MATYLTNKVATCLSEKKTESHKASMIYMGDDMLIANNITRQWCIHDILDCGCLREKGMGERGHWFGHLIR